MQRSDEEGRQLDLEHAPPVALREPDACDRPLGADALTVAIYKYALVEVVGRDPDDWPEMTPENGRKLERQLGDAGPDDLLDGVGLDGERFFIHAREIERVSYWE